MIAEHNAVVAGAPVDPALQEQLHQQLLEQRATLAQRLDELQGAESAVASDHVVADAALARTTEALDEVEAALRRLEAGTYGWCEVCHDAIPAERLEVLPAAARCVRCQTQAPSMLR